MSGGPPGGSGQEGFGGPGGGAEESQAGDPWAAAQQGSFVVTPGTQQGPVAEQVPAPAGAGQWRPGQATAAPGTATGDFAPGAPGPGVPTVREEGGKGLKVGCAVMGILGVVVALLVVAGIFVIYSKSAKEGGAAIGRAHDIQAELTINTGVRAEQVHFANESAYTDDIAALKAFAPEVTWVKGTSPADAKQLAVKACDDSGTAVLLQTRSSSGKTLVALLTAWDELPWYGVGSKQCPDDTADPGEGWSKTTDIWQS